MMVIGVLLPNHGPQAVHSALWSRSYMTLNRLCSSGILGKQSTLSTFHPKDTKFRSKNKVDIYENPYYKISIGQISGKIWQIQENTNFPEFLYYLSLPERKTISPETLGQNEKYFLGTLFAQLDTTWTEFSAPQPKIYMIRTNELEPQKIVTTGARQTFNIYVKKFTDTSTFEMNKSFDISVYNLRLLSYYSSISELRDQREERTSEQAKSIALKFLYDNKIKVPIQSLSARKSSELDARATKAHGGDGPLIFTRHWIVTVKSASSKVDGQEVIVAAGNLKEEDPPRFSIPFYV